MEKENKNTKSCTLSFISDEDDVDDSDFCLFVLQMTGYSFSFLVGSRPR